MKIFINKYLKKRKKKKIKEDDGFKKIKTVFGRTNYYYSLYEIENDLKIILRLIDEVRKPQILSYCGFETIYFDIDPDFLKREKENILTGGVLDNRFICDSMIEYFFRLNTDKGCNIRQNILNNSIENKTETKLLKKK